MKIQKNIKPQEVVSHVTPSTDPEETRKREGQARRMATGQARWNTSGKRTDTDKGGDK